MNSLDPRVLPMIDGPRMWPPKNPLRYSLINVAQLRQAAHRLRLLLPPHAQSSRRRPEGRYWCERIVNRPTLMRSMVLRNINTQRRTIMESQHVNVLHILQEYFQVRRKGDLITAEFIRQHFPKYEDFFVAIDNFRNRDDEGRLEN